MKAPLLFAAGALAALCLAATPAGAQSAIGKIDPALRDLMIADPSAPRPVIVEMQHARPPFLGAVNVGRALEALQLLRLTGLPISPLPLINAAAGFADAAGIDALSLTPEVAFVHYDRPVGVWQSTAAPPPSNAVQGSAVYPRVVKANRLWQEGVSGRGVAVAVLDSGVAPYADLAGPTSRLLASVNFADERATPDPGGHGTHVAGIIAGNGSRSAGEFVGVAPQASIVDVRVLGSSGGGRISSVVRGIEWVLEHRAAYNIRVINLAFSARTPLASRADPLSAAVEMAWRRGMVVVAAAGNGGPNRGSVMAPGSNPYVITVGATDDRGTALRGDDVLAWFSGWGAVDSSNKPDFVAPGRRLVSLRVPGSTLDALYPERVVAAQNGATYFRLTGTSMATAVASGAAALLLQRRPGLTPDQVKSLLLATTQPYGQDSGQVLLDPSADGKGLIDVYTANSTSVQQSSGGLLSGLLQPVLRLVSPSKGLRPSDGFARAMYPVLYGTPLRWKNPTLGGLLWNLLTWDTLSWDSIAWDNLDWDSVAWDSVAWDRVEWDSVAWDSVAWDSVAWDSVAWDTYTLD